MSMNLDESAAAFLEFQKVIRNINFFGSSSLGYIVSEEAVEKWSRDQYKRKRHRSAIDLYDSLQPVISRLSASVEPCCGGRLSGKRTCWIGSQKGDLCNPSSFDLEELEKQCNPAPFGDLTTYKTVYDPTVRIALECPAEKLNIRLDKDTMEILQEEIETNLTKGYRVKLRPYKVNIYKEGGFFKGHVDTPREGMVGTLVLISAHEHTGGELVVYHNNSSTTFQQPNPNSKSKLTWAAFYSDCVHEVLPVKSGIRLSLTFDILLEESISPETVFNKKGDLLKLISMIKNSHLNCLGLLLTFKYTLDNINSTHLKEKTIDMLSKGADKVIADAVARKWKCSLLPVLYKTYATSYDDYALDTYDSTVLPFRKEDFMYYLGKEEKPYHKLKEVPFFLFDGTGLNLKRKEKEVAYTGNEAEHFMVEKVYMHAALIIDKRPKTTSHIVWSPQNHRKFSRPVRQQVECIIMLTLIKPDGKPWHPESPWWKLPRDILYLIFQLVLDDYIELTYDPFEEEEQEEGEEEEGEEEQEGEEEERKKKEKKKERRRMKNSGNVLLK